MVDAEEIIGMDLENLADDTHFYTFTVQSLDGGRLDIDSINLDPGMLSSGIVEGIESECEQILLDDNNSLPNSDMIEQGTIVNNGSVEVVNDQSAIDARYNLINSADILLDGGTTVEVLDAQAILDGKGIQILEGIIDSNKIIDTNSMIQFDCDISTPIDNPQPSSAKRKRDEKIIKSNLNINNLNSIEAKKNKTKPTTIKKSQSLFENVDETNTNLSFIKWLASITERINQTMHFQFNGKPDPLVFHVPQVFFDCLRERISCGGKKKRLPNSTTAFVRKDAVPLGTFTKYSWQITNVIHVKSIFDTQLIPLEITRSFVQNSDGTYELSKREETEMERYKKTGNNALIKPLELKTFLKVGNTSPNQVEPTPFIIEWIPDILPISKIGELRIRFEFGHVTAQKNIKMAVSKKY